MVYNDEATIWKKKTATSLLLLQFKETPPGPAPPLTGKNVLISLCKPTIFVGKCLYQFRNITVNLEGSNKDN